MCNQTNFVSKIIFIMFILWGSVFLENNKIQAQIVKSSQNILPNNLYSQLPKTTITETRKAVEIILKHERKNGNQFIVKAEYYNNKDLEVFIDSNNNITLKLIFILNNRLYSSILNNDFYSGIPSSNNYLKENTVIDNNINKVNIKHISFSSEMIEIITPPHSTRFHDQIIDLIDFDLKYKETIKISFTYQDFQKLLEGNNIYIQIYKDLYILSKIDIDNLQLFLMEVDRVINAPYNRQNESPIQISPFSN